MDPNVEKVIERAVQGDRDALVQLLQTHGPKARAALAGRIPRRWQALLSVDDVMQQAYADAAVGIGQFTSLHDGAFAKWLITIAERSLGNALKALEAEKRGGDRRRIIAESDESYVALLDVLAQTTTTPSRVSARNEAHVALRRAIGQLPDAYASVVRMYDLEGRPIGEVAHALGRSEGAVYMLRARAHERLHEIMGRTSEFFSGSA